VIAKTRTKRADGTETQESRYCLIGWRLVRDNVNERCEERREGERVRKTREKSCW
jgi:hypothetical protein